MAHGLIVAFIGVDGSGKSSVIEALDIPNSRIMYFGNNNFWLPGFERFFQKHRSNKGALGATLKTIAAIDVKFRSIPALISKASGKVVLCDRFYYDQQVGGKLAKIVGWAPISPDLALYLKVTPEVAVERKGDHSLEQTRQTVAGYDTLLDHYKLTVIDANRPFEEVLKSCEEKIKEHLK